MSSPLDLFDDNDGEEESLKINQRFAKEYETRKQLQELRNARQEGIDSDDSSSSSESEDEDGDLLSPSVDISILKTISALRNKDERIYDSSNRFFPQVESSSDSDEDSNQQEKKKHKPKKYKDVVREQVLEQMEQEGSDNDALQGDDNTKRNVNSNHLLYNQEQEELRSAFLESTRDNVDGSDDDDDSNDWMVLKKRAKKEDDDDTQQQQLIEQELEALKKTSATANSNLVDPRGEVENAEEFLFDFIKNKKWIDKDNHGDNDDSSDEEHHGNRKISSNENDGDDSMEELDRADDFEAKYNFRFEQAKLEAGTSGADYSVVSYARSAPQDTVRRKDESRKQKRLERKQRKALERQQKEEQLRRLKNAKRQEMQAKLDQIKSVLGHVEGRGMAVDEATIMKLMEGDYDPDQFEQIMNQAYGDDFYQQQDAEWKTDHDVRETLLKDEDGNMIAGLDDEAGGLYDNDQDGDDEYGENEGDDGHVQKEDEWNDDEYYNHEESNDQQQEETETERKLKEKMNDELYKLDYEDIVAGMPTRFKYRSVPKNNYGLSTEEILFAKDSTLKSFVSLKKMAPYREDGEYHVGSKKRRRFRDMLKQDIEEAMEEMGEQQPQVDREDEQGEAEVPKKKRRRQKKGKKRGSEEGDSKPAAKPEGDYGKDVPNEEGKRKRKKKGKKISNKNEEAQSKPDVSSAVANVDSKDAEEVESNKVTKENEKSSSKKSKNKKRKKKNKSKGVAIEGVSASRLASYNL